MASISAIATRGAASPVQPVGLRRAVVARRAVMGDRTTFGENARAVLSARYWRRPGCIVPVAARGRRVPSAADLAVLVSRQLLATMPAIEPSTDVGAVIYCHEAPDLRVSESTVGRLQFDLELRAANPFAISQAHHAALWIALDLAAGLVDGPEAARHVLLVASDKLAFGGPAAQRRALLFSDSAAAALVSQGDRGAWGIEQVCVRHFATPCDAHAAWPAEESEAFADFGAGVVRDMLRDGGLTASALQQVITPLPDPAFARRLHLAAGLPPGDTAAARPARPAAAMADLLALLAAAESGTPPGGRVLAWSAGNNGEFACCVLKRQA